MILNISIIITVINKNIITADRNQIEDNLKQEFADPNYNDSEAGRSIR